MAGSSVVPFIAADLFEEDYSWTSGRSPMSWWKNEEKRIELTSGGYGITRNRLDSTKKTSDFINTRYNDLSIISLFFQALYNCPFFTEIGECFAIGLASLNGINSVKFRLLLKGFTKSTLKQYSLFSLLVKIIIQVLIQKKLFL
jgi:hypothetical protein